MNAEHPDMRGRVVLIIGGTSGLGLSAATCLIRHGARVVVTGPDGDEVDAARVALGERGDGLAADATVTGSAEAAVALAVKRWGRLDALYHVAGGSGRSRGDGALHELTDEGWDWTLELNLKSVMFSNRAAVRQFRGQGGGGVILNMGSVLGWSPSPEHFASHAYAASKAAIVGFSRSLAAYYARENIRVNVIAPGLVETAMSRRAVEDEGIRAFIRRKQPLDGGRVGVPADLDGAAVFLLSEASRFVTGQVLAVDGGWTVSEGR
jgi:NAD(P)-dependent dehydrogenase (short-subunit alcohol dehydrogenase family)